MMEVPCCTGLGVLVEQAIEQAKVKVNFKKTIIGIEGNKT